MYIVCYNQGCLRRHAETQSLTPEQETAAKKDFQQEDVLEQDHCMAYLTCMASISHASFMLVLLVSNKMQHFGIPTNQRLPVFAHGSLSKLIIPLCSSNPISSSLWKMDLGKRKYYFYMEKLWNKS